MPQTPTPEWLALVEPDVEPGETPADLHQRIVHRLGNLTLTGYNPDLSNKPYPEKRMLLAMSKFSMSSELAQQASWGLPQIEARGKAVANRPAEIWPGPLSTRRSTQPDQWPVVRRVCAALPAGTWTAYGDVAAVTGIHPKPLGNYLAAQGVANAWRVLRSDGAVSSEFRWPEPDRTDAPRDVLAAEGVQFDDKGRADTSQRLTPVDLAGLISIEVPQESTGQGHEQRFWMQPTPPNPATCDAVDVSQDWRTRRHALVGQRAQASFPDTRTPDGTECSPWTLKPTSDTLEVVFQHLLGRPPFDDTAVRTSYGSASTASPVSISRCHG